MPPWKVSLFTPDNKITKILPEFGDTCLSEKNTASVEHLFGLLLCSIILKQEAVNL